MKTISRLLFCSLLTAASLQAQAGCYTVYDSANRVLLQSEQPPVDMSMPLHEALAARFPGAHMVFDTLADCPSISLARQAPVRGGTPLLTNTQTAQAQHLPYTQMGGGIALVQPGEARMGPGVTVMPSGTALAAAPPRRDTVITEYRDAQGRTVEVAGREQDPTRSMGAGPAPRRLVTAKP